MADFDEAIRRDAKFGEAYRERGNTWFLQGDRDKAMADLNQSIELDPRRLRSPVLPGQPPRGERRGRGRPGRLRRGPEARADLCPGLFPAGLGVRRPRANGNRPGRLPANSSASPPKAPTLTRAGAGRRTRPAAAAPSIGSKPCWSSRSPKPAPFRSRARPFTRRASSTRPSPNMTRHWSCIPATPRSTTIAAWPTARKATWTRRSAITTQAIELDPKYVPAYSNRGFAYYKKDDLDRALADYDKILQLDPTNEDAKKSREAILAMRRRRGRGRQLGAGINGQGSAFGCHVPGAAKGVYCGDTTPFAALGTCHPF